VTEVSSVPYCSFVHVEPASVDDWEILVSNIVLYWYCSIWWQSSTC